MNRIKNINSINIFHVVAQHQNATLAAKQLNTNQSAISYHIKKLEDETGVKLFERTAKGLELTVQGTILASHVDQGLNMIQKGLQVMNENRRNVRVAVVPMFASRWLSFRLGGMWEAYPDLRLSFISHNNNYVRHSRPHEVADLGIQWGRGEWQGFHATRLWPEEMVVVCSPQYLQSHPIVDPADLTRCKLLHVDNERMWTEWFSNLRLTLPKSQQQIMLEDRHFQLNATINGLGVSLFSRRMIIEELTSGTLVNPLQTTYESSFAYHLVEPTGFELSEQARVFRDWLFDHCQQA